MVFAGSPGVVCRHTRDHHPPQLLFSFIMFIRAPMAIMSIIAFLLLLLPRPLCYRHVHVFRSFDREGLYARNPGEGRSVVPEHHFRVGLCVHWYLVQEA